jgi:hypothetical protein
VAAPRPIHRPNSRFIYKETMARDVPVASDFLVQTIIITVQHVLPSILNLYLWQGK